MQLLLQIHSFLRWIILLLLVLVLINSFIGFTKNKLFTLSDNKLSLWLISAVDIMLILGLIQYIIGSNGIAHIKNLGMKATMGDKVARFFAIEHIFTMVLAIILLHIGRVKCKNAKTEAGKHKMLFWFTLIATLLIVARIPWPFMGNGIARGWF
jgi:hypothetical protein